MITTDKTLLEAFPKKAVYRPVLLGCEAARGGRRGGAPSP
jgi:hypothetical protein